MRSFGSRHEGWGASSDDDVRCPARPVHEGDRVRIRKGEVEWEIDVLALSDRRGPATVATTLYAETGDSVARRAASAEQRRLLHSSPHPDRRPDKRGRRRIRAFTGRE